MGSSLLSAYLGLLLFVLMPAPVVGFGAGNIPSISKLEGKNWRHGDIEDCLKLIAFIKGHKWTSMMIKRCYFGNWLRDYSQALDVGTLKGASADNIRILIWILSFLTFNFATAEFEVTPERLGCYRPEEHIDNPRGYADNEDARKYDQRLRPPVQPEELAIDPETAMKNYIANENGQWATSSGYVKFSLARSIHFGRVYTSGANGTSGHEQDLCEALRCLGQGLHCLEDLAAHSNYIELALIELGCDNVFPHTGSSSWVSLQGKYVFPLVTGSFGGVDFLHSVIGEATDHVASSQVPSEVDQMDKALELASMHGDGSSARALSGVTDLLSRVPGTGHLCREAAELQADSDAQKLRNLSSQSQTHMACIPKDAQIHYESVPSTSFGSQTNQPSFNPSTFEEYHANQSYPAELPTDYNTAARPASSFAPESQSSFQQHFPPPPTQPLVESEAGTATTHDQGEPPMVSGAHSSLQGQSGAGGVDQILDAQATIKKIYPILAFRDNVVRTVSSIIYRIPGLEHLVETIQESVNLFIMSLLAPYIRPIIRLTAAQLKVGATGVISASAKQQFEPWDDPNCTDPTHSLLSKDHFSNILNEPAGRVAAEILKYVAPRVVYAWENPEVPVEEVLTDVTHVFHHPASRQAGSEIQQEMFDVVRQWANNFQGGDLNDLLSSESVKQGRNHIQEREGPHLL